MGSISNSAPSATKATPLPREEKQNSRSSQRSGEAENPLTADTPLDLLRREPTTSQELARGPNYSQSPADSDAGQAEFDLLEQVGGVFTGAGEAGLETIKGLISIGVSAVKTGYDIILDPILDSAKLPSKDLSGTELQRPDWLPDANRGLDRIKTGIDTVGTLASNPGMIVDAAIDPIKEDWNQNRFGEAIGRGAVGVVDVVVGLKGASKLTKTLKSAGTPEIPNLDSLIKSQGFPARGTNLPKGDRLKIYTEMLKQSPPAKNATQALELLEKNMNAVEDAYTGVQKAMNPGLKYDGRMYAPRKDYTTKLANGSIEAETKGNIIKLSKDGDIEFFLKSKDGAQGAKVFHKPGAGND